MALPRKLKAFAAFLDGINYMGEVPEVTLPKLSRKMEEYRGGGMNGPVDLDYGQEKMEAEIKAAGWVAGLAEKWGAAAHDAVLIRFAGAVQADDSEAVTPVEVVMRGRLQERDPGNAKAGDGTERTYKYTLSYYKEVVDGQVVIEIDLVNMIENVGGVDNLAGTRAALGI
ncbi:phage major tail tube protein [Paracidovorax valerianellae]|uniref:phage major tail tube protein n=1 Tax=Paracidovorax valerianellae TaxID=187868 RepID=UPI002302F5A0|nr:phage major tail tube protein [Paracidovorax valerianellae]MDA8444773.1 phage major tail tube protein [Paracidovorax valerianellae]